MLAQTVRSGLVESRHPVEVVAVAPDGTELARWGDLGRPYFARSAVKPIQATVVNELGAGLDRERLAVACASHDAEPVHVAYVRAMLAEVGLSEADLACPPAEPSGVAARRRAGRTGPAARSLFHNCSGKHAGMLRACVAQGWPTAGYTDPDHPLQQRILDEMAAATGEDPRPVGVDGCGAPTFRLTTSGLARAFARIAVEERFRPAVAAMTGYPALTAGTNRAEPKIARALNAAVKGGAEGCLGVAVLGRIGVAAKADDGSFDAATVGMIAALRALGLVPETVAHEIAGAEQLPVYGGGRQVGWIEAVAP